MKSIQKQIRARLLDTQTQATDVVPLWLRRILRTTSGGDEWTARFLRGMLWKYRWLIIIGLVANLGSGFAEATTLAAFTLVLNQISAAVTNTPAETGGTLNTLFLQFAGLFGNRQPVFILAALAVIFQLSRSVFDYAGAMAAAHMRVWVEADLQRRIFKKMIDMRFNQIVSSRLGDLASYSSQIEQVGYFVQTLNQVINDGIIVIAYTSVLFWVSWQFTLVAIVVLGLLSLALTRLRTTIRRSIGTYVRVSVNLNERVLEYLQALRLIHIFVREEMVINDVNALINSGIAPRRKALLRRAILNPIFQTTAIMGIVVVISVGYWIVTTRQWLNIGELIAYLFIVYRTMPRLAAFNGQLGLLFSQLPYLERVAQLLDPAGKEMEYLPGRDISALRQGIEFRAVSLRYPEAERDALNQVSLTIAAGQMVAFVGSSGSGKSSVINLLLGLYRPTGGSIVVDGQDLLTYDLAAWRRLIGVVDQDSLIFSSSIESNIRFGKPDATDEEVRAAARIANAHDFIEEMPQGYATEVGDRGYRMSGGQRQRIAIARAVIHNPTLLLFDEATSALDSQSERLIQASMEELRKDRTLVVIAHRLSTIAKADEIIVLDNGQVVERGTHHELLARGGRYAAMWRLQAEPT